MRRPFLGVRWIAALALAIGAFVVVALSPTLAMPYPSASPPLSTSVHTSATFEACRAVIAVHADLSNDSSANYLTPTGTIPIFWRLCPTPPFASLIDKWGVSNFSLGFESGPGESFAFYGVDWTAACTNASFAPAQRCGFSEYWTGNLITGVLTGPTAHEGAWFPICACPAHIVPAPAPANVAAEVLPILAGPAIGIAGGFIAVWWARRARADSDAEGPE